MSPDVVGRSETITAPSRNLDTLENCALLREVYYATHPTEASPFAALQLASVKSRTFADKVSRVVELRFSVLTQQRQRENDATQISRQNEPNGQNWRDTTKLDREIKRGRERKRYVRFP